MCANAMEVLCWAVGFCLDDEALMCSGGCVAGVSLRTFAGGVVRGVSMESSLGGSCR